MRFIRNFINNILEQKLDKMLKKKQFAIFEKEMQKKVFAYTADLNDIKSDYLKRYLETRLECLSNSVTSLSSELQNILSRIEEHEIKFREYVDTVSRMKNAKKKLEKT